MDMGAGVFDCFVKTGKHPKVNVSQSLFVGARCSIYRPHRKPREWEKLASVTIADIPVDRKSHPTNELRFSEPLPPGIKPGDVLIYEGS